MTPAGRDLALAQLRITWPLAAARSIVIRRLPHCSNKNLAGSPTASLRAVVGSYVLAPAEMAAGRGA
jgi:hypothetical protein